jgi:hypothetical protein
MKELQKSQRDGKIIVHSEGAGVPSPDAIRERARELAVIAGRATSDFTDGDWEQAKHELLRSGTPPADEDQMISTVTTWDEAPGTTGHQVKNYGPQDEANIAEELVTEGVEEALHDEMVEARKRNIDEAS